MGCRVFTRSSTTIYRNRNAFGDGARGRLEVSSMKALLRSICRSVGDVFAICLFANVLLVTSLRADSKTDNAKEIGEITVICRSIIGSQFPYDGLPWQRPWQRLLRYLPD